MIIATFPEIPILVNFLPKYDYIALLETQVARLLGNIIVDRPAVRLLIVQVDLLGSGIGVPDRGLGSDGRDEVGGHQGRRGDLVAAEQPLRRGCATSGPRQRGLGLVLRRRVSHPLEDPHQQDVRRQVVHLGVHEHSAFRAAELAVGAHDLLQALLAERVLARQDLAGGVESLQAHRALQQVVQHALVHLVNLGNFACEEPR